MKKLFLLLALACTFAHISAQAQIPNGDFENLNYDGTIQNWGNVYLFNVSIDSSGNNTGDIILFDNGYFYTPSADAHSGNTALLLSNALNTTTNDFIVGSASVDEDSVFSAWGSLEFIPVSTPIRPESLNFYYKFTPEQNDTAIVRLALYDSMGSVVGEVNYLIIGSQQTYALVSAPITYYSNEPIASYSLNFSTFYSEISDYSHHCHYGTRLWIDDVTFEKTTGIQSAETSLSAKIYPNPAKNYFLIDRKENILSVSLLDISGKEILLSVEENKQVNCANLASGVYSVKVETDKGILNGKLVVGE